MINILAADKLMQPPQRLRHLPAVDALGAVRAPARGGRPGQAQARVLLRRGAPAVQRRAQGAAGEDRAGGAADPLQGRRRLFRHAESARRARHGARPARQPRAARAARLHAARPEGGEDRGRPPCAPNPEARTREGRSPSWASARRWSRSSTRRAGRAWSSARSILPPASRIGPATPQEREQAIKSSLVYGHYEQTVDRESAYEKLAAAAQQRG